jgi:hypothetical protein
MGVFAPLLREEEKQQAFYELYERLKPVMREFLQRADRMHTRIHGPSTN